MVHMTPQLPHHPNKLPLDIKCLKIVGSIEPMGVERIMNTTLFANIIVY